MLYPKGISQLMQAKLQVLMQNDRKLDTSLKNEPNLPPKKLPLEVVLKKGYIV